MISRFEANFETVRVILVPISNIMEFDMGKEVRSHFASDVLNDLRFSNKVIWVGRASSHIEAIEGGARRK